MGEFEVWEGDIPHPLEPGNNDILVEAMERMKVAELRLLCTSVGITLGNKKYRAAALARFIVQRLNSGYRCNP